MKFWLRWTANGLTVFLALYLVDSIADGRFRVTALWAAVVLAVVLGLLNSLVPPLRRARTKPVAAVISAIVTLLLNILVLQLFVWLGSSLTVASVVWVLAVAVFIALLTGTVSWLVGFGKKERPGQAPRRRNDSDPRRQSEAKASRNQT